MMSKKKRKYIRINDVVEDYGIGRTTANKLISEKKVKSHLLRDKGARRGLRLIEVKSLEKYIQGKANS